MRQAVRVGRQILLSRMRSKGKTGIQSVAAVWRDNLALRTALSSVMSRSKAKCRRGRYTHCRRPHQIWDGEMDFDPVCVDDCRTVVCRAQDRAGEGTGRQLCFPYTRVRITIASAPIRAFKT